MELKSVFPSGKQMEQAQRTLLSPEGKGAFQSFLLGLLLPNQYMAGGGGAGRWPLEVWPHHLPYGIDATPQTAP